MKVCSVTMKVRKKQRKPMPQHYLIYALHCIAFDPGSESVASLQAHWNTLY